MITVSTYNTNEVWENLYKQIFINKETKIQNSRLGETLELMKVCISIENSRDRWICSRIPMISPAFAIAEIFWILSGSEDSSFINTWNPTMKNFLGNSDIYDGAYGYRLIHNLGYNQIYKVYEILKYNPDSRQAVLQIWDGKKDLPLNDGIPNNLDIPCNLISMLKIRNNKLDWSQIMRGNDFFRGMPYNFIQFTTLQEIIAGWLNLDIGEYFYFTDSLHVYKSDLEKFSLRGKNILSENPDKLLFSKNEFDKFFPKCIEILKKVQEFNIKEIDIVNLKNCILIPQEYKNLLSIPLAYLALKDNKINLVKDCERLCSNSLLLEIWMFWKIEIYNKY